MRGKNVAKRAVALLAAAALAALLAPLAWADEPAELADADESAALYDAVDVGATPNTVSNAAKSVLRFNWMIDGERSLCASCLLVNSDTVVTAYGNAFFSEEILRSSGADEEAIRARCSYSVVTQGNKEVAATMICYSETLDIAIMKLSKPITDRAPITIREGDSVQIGDSVFAVNASKLDASGFHNAPDVLRGAVTEPESRLTTVLSSSGLKVDCNVVSAGFGGSSAKGCGGGPLLDVSGYAVGVLFCSSGETLYAVSIDQVTKMLDSIGTEYAVDDVDPNRIAGADRYETSAAVARKAYPDGCEGAIIATGATFPDALAASALAGVKGWPILTTEPGSLNAATKSAIEKLGTKRFIIVGGTNAVSSDVANALKGYGSVERIAGVDRYQTAEKIYCKGAGMGAWSKTAIIACGSNYPDALSISGYACKTASPIFLASPSGLTFGTKTLLRDGGFERVVIVGGTAAVPSDVDKWVKSDLGVSPERLQGADRYATSRAIGEFCVGEGMSADKACIATGANFPDALAGASLVARNNSLMLLAADGCYESFKVLSAHKGSINGLYYLGGKNAVMPDMKAAAKQAAGL